MPDAILRGAASTTSPPDRPGFQAPSRDDSRLPARSASEPAPRRIGRHHLTSPPSASANLRIRRPTPTGRRYLTAIHPRVLSPGFASARPNADGPSTLASGLIAVDGLCAQSERALPSSPAGASPHLTPRGRRKLLSRKTPAPWPPPSTPLRFPGNLGQSLCCAPEPGRRAQLHPRPNSNRRSHGTGTSSA